MKTISTCILLAVLPCEATRADLITFALGKSAQETAVDGVPSGSITVDGLTVTLTANSGKLNATGSYFGIDADAADASDRLDGGGGINEAITFTFDQPVEFTQLTLGVYSSGEAGSLKIGNNDPLTLVPAGAALDVYDFTSHNFLGSGQSATLSYISGNGFSLEGIQVNTVPEPTTLTLSALALAGLLHRRRDRRLPKE